jgi:hypothetical protein
LATGNFTLSLSTTAGSPGVINYRFLNGAVVLQAFGTTNTVTLGPEYRTVTITGQVREEISTNNLGSPVYDTSFSSDTITVPLIATDTTFTASSPTISWDAATFTTTLTDVQIGDEVRAVLTSNTGVIFENFTTVTDTTFDLVCNNATVNSTNLPTGSATSVTIQVKRPTAVGGDDNTVTGPTFNVTRNYRGGPFGSVAVTTPAVADRTIGAQQYFAYDIGQSEQVRITGAGVISGATYIARVQSGTTEGGATAGIVYNQTASGTEPDAATTAGGLDVNQLPPVDASVTYRVFCIVPTSLGGDGTTEWRCTTLTVPLPTSNLDFIMARSYYVEPDNTFDKSTSATLVSASDYRVGVSSTSETISYTNGGSTSEYRLQKLIGISPIGGVVGSVSSGTSGTFSISNANLPPNPGDAQGYTIEFRVPTVNDGSGQWFSNIGSYSFYFQREQLIQPTLGTLQAYANSSSLSQIVPTVERTNNSGNGLIEYAWSSTNSTPTNWTSLGALGFVAGFDIAAGGIARSASNLYMGVREKSPIDGTTTTATYVSNTNGPWVNEVNTLASRLITMTYDGNDYEPSQGQQVVIEATELTKNVTVSGSLSSSLAKTAYTETQVAPDTAGFSITSSVTNYSSFALRTDAAATLDGVAQSANYLVGSDTTNSAGNSTFTIDNPTEIVDAGNTLGYTLYEYVFTARGGDGVEVATTPAIDNNMVIRRRGVIDDTITVTVPKKNLAPADGSQTITIADGGNGTEYRIRVTGYTDANSDGSPPGIGTTVGTPASITGNGSIVLDASDLPEEGDTVSYKVQFRESGTSDAYFYYWKNTELYNYRWRTKYQQADEYRI